MLRRIDNWLIRIDQWLCGHCGVPIGGRTIRCRIEIMFGLREGNPPYNRKS